MYFLSQTTILNEYNHQTYCAYRKMSGNIPVFRKSTIPKVHNSMSGTILDTEQTRVINHLSLFTLIKLSRIS